MSRPAHSLTKPSPCHPSPALPSPFADSWKCALQVAPTWCHACTHMLVYVYIPSHMHTHTLNCTHSRMCTHSHAHIHIFPHTHTQAHTHSDAHMYTLTCVHTFVCGHVYTCSHTHTYIVRVLMFPVSLLVSFCHLRKFPFASSFRKCVPTKAGLVPGDLQAPGFGGGN